MISNFFFGDRETFCKIKFKDMFIAAVLTMAAIILILTMDTVIAAQFFGDSSMAGINLIKPILYLSVFFTAMISTGTSYLYSFEIGAFRNEYANKLVGQGTILTIILAIVIGIIVFLGEEIFFSFFSNSGAAEYSAREYYSCLPFILAVHTVYAFMQTIIYVDGGGKNCVIAMIAQFAVNFFASIILGLKFGVFGIALGSLIGYLPAILIFAKWIFFDSQTLKPILFFSVSETVKILKLSYVHASIYLHIGLANFILNAFFLRTFGDKYFPILSVIVSILQFSLFLDGIGQAAEPLINVYLGEKNFDGIKKIMSVAMRSALTLGAVTIPIIFLLSENIAGIFGIRDELFAETVFAIKIISFAMPFLALLYLFAMYYQILGHLKIALALSFCKDFVFYATLPIIFSLAVGLSGMWLGMLAVSIVTCAIFIIFLRARYKKDFPLLLPEKDIISRDAVLNLEKVVEFCDWVEEELLKRDFDEKIAMRVTLIIEEIGMLIVENNPKISAFVEVTIFFDENVKIIIRDNGARFDLTDEQVNSFRNFFVYSFLEGTRTDRRYLTTQNYNRHIFRLEDK